MSCYIEQLLTGSRPLHENVTYKKCHLTSRAGTKCYQRNVFYLFLPINAVIIVIRDFHNKYFISSAFSNFHLPEAVKAMHH